MRSCGDCKACCWHAEVDELEKPAGEWCTHCDVKAKLGCRIYDRRPKACADFLCAWMTEPDEIPEDLWPRRSRVLITYLLEEKTMRQTGYAVWPLIPGAHHSSKVCAWIEEMRQSGHRVVVVDARRHETEVVAQGRYRGFGLG